MIPPISFRPSLHELQALKRAEKELNRCKSDIIRAALNEWLDGLKAEGVVSSAPPLRHQRRHHYLPAGT